MDYERLRKFPLNVVLGELGFDDWKWRKNGTEGFGACPVCKPKRNRTCFSFNEDGRYHCFSCQLKGKGAIDLVKAVKDCGFQEAVDWLSSISTSKPEPVAVETAPNVEKLENEPYKATYEKYKVKSEWLEQRGFTQETLNHFGVFEYHNPARKSLYSHKIMIPIRRFSDGACVGYLVRNPNPAQGEPKYLFPKGVAKHLELFGSYELRSKGLLKVGYLVESPLCVMKFHQMGLPAVSCYGWSTSPQQLQILQQLAKGWVYLPDANVRNQALSQLSLLASLCWVKAPEYPATDPEHLTREQVLALT